MLGYIDHDNDDNSPSKGGMNENLSFMKVANPWSRVAKFVLSPNPEIE